MEFLEALSQETAEESRAVELSFIRQHVLNFKFSPPVPPSLPTVAVDACISRVIIVHSSAEFFDTHNLHHPAPFGIHARRTNDEPQPHGRACVQTRLNTGARTTAQHSTDLIHIHDSNNATCPTATTTVRE